MHSSKAGKFFFVISKALLLILTFLRIEENITKRGLKGSLTVEMCLTAVEIVMVSSDF